MWRRAQLSTWTWGSATLAAISVAWCGWLVAAAHPGWAVFSAVCIALAIGVHSRDLRQLWDAQNDLRHNEERFRALVEEGFDGLNVFDAHGSILYSSPRNQRLLGYDPTETSGRCCFDFVHWEDLAEARRAWGEILRSPDQPATVELRLRHRDGTWHGIEITLRNLLDHVAVRGIVAHWRDLTEPRRQEQARRESEQRFALFMRHLPGLAWIKDERGRYVYANEAAQRLMVGSTAPAELYGKSDDEVFPADAAAVFRESDQRVRASGKAIETVETLRHDDGAVHHWLAARFPIPRTNHNADMVGGIAIDITERIQAEAAQRAAEAGYRDIFENAVDAISRTTPEGRYLLANPALAQMLGYDSPAALMASIDDAGRQIYADPERRQQALRIIEADGALRGFETELVRRDGRRIWASINARLVRDAQGRPLYYDGITEDVTDRKRAEEALRKASAFRETMIRTAAEGICVCLLAAEQPRLFFSVWNDRMTEITGYTKDEINRLGWHETLYPDAEVRARAIDRMARMRASGDDLKGEESTITRSDGAQRILSISTSRVESDDGAPAAVALIQDITERRQAEDERERHFNLLQAVIEGATDPIFVKDFQGRYLLMNTAGLRFLGRSGAEVIGRDDEALFPPEVAAELRSVDHGILTTGEVVRLEECIDSAQGARVLSTTKGPYRDGQGRIVGLFGITQDITQRRRAEEKLALQQAELLHVSRLSTLGQLVAALSHEIAQPLSAVGNFASACLALLRSDPPAWEDGSGREIKGYLDEIAKQSQRAGAILHRLRDFSRKTPERREPCEVSAVLEESVELVAGDLRRHGVAVSWELESPSPRVSADRVQLQQVLVNLLTNARDAMLDVEAARRRVTIRSAVRAGQAVIEVEDRGRGLLPETRERLFQPFFTTKPAGMGMGLSICQGIIRAHGGEIEARDNPEGGVTFLARLPLSK